MEIDGVQDVLEGPGEEAGSQLGGVLWEQTGRLPVEETGALAEGGLELKVDLKFERQVGL